MKKSLWILAMIISATAMAQPEKPFSIKGSFKNIALPVQKVFFSYRAGDKNVTDSMVPQDGRYTFSGKIAEPTLSSLRIKYQPDADGKPIKMKGTRDFTTIFLGAENMEIVSVDSFSNVTVKGSKTHQAYLSLKALLKPVNDVMTALVAEYSKASAAKDEPARKTAEDKLDSMDIISRRTYGEYASKNIQSSPIAMFALAQFAGWDINVAEVEPLFNRLSAAQKELPSIKKLAGQIAIARKTTVGSMAMNFTQNDTLGMPITLASFKGKYLLVDFWASWCGPCRRENPNVVIAYNQFKGKGFDILGVSLDQPGAKEKWLKAIHDDNLTWTHVSDLKYWQNEVAQQYGIQAIPQNLLLDPQGKIIAKNLNGGQLQKKLAEILTP